MFASEIAPLLETPAVCPDGRCRPRSTTSCAFGLVDHSDQTMFADIRRLPAGTLLPCSGSTDRRPRPGRYAAAPAVPTSGTTKERDGTAAAAVPGQRRLHLRSDVPVGAALSGGIDSSSVVAAMRAVGPADMDLHTFTYCRRRPGAGRARLGPTSSRARPGRDARGPRRPCAAEQRPRRAAAHQGEPVPGTSIYAQWQVFRAAQDGGVTVLLDGQGGDELFAGYRPFLWAAIAEDLRAGRLRAAAGQVRLAAALDGTGSTRSIWARPSSRHCRTALAADAGHGRDATGMAGYRWFADRCPTPPCDPVAAAATSG